MRACREVRIVSVQIFFFSGWLNIMRAKTWIMPLVGLVFRKALRLRRMKTLMNKLTWTRMNIEPFIPVSPFLFFLPSFVFYSARSNNTHHDPCSPCVFSFLLSNAYLSVTCPPSTPLTVTLQHHLLLLRSSPIVICTTYRSYHRMSNAEPSPAWRFVRASSEFFKSVNITDIVIPERAMASLEMQLFICLWCAVILFY